MRSVARLQRGVRRSIGPAIVLVLVTIPAVALANHQFNDVPNSNPFHDDIAAIADAGITAGFPDGGYHPADPVTRQAMAAFMHRGFGHVAIVNNAAVETNEVAVAATDGGSPVVPVREITVEVPGATNAFSPEQLVYLEGRVVFGTAMDAATKGCPCEFIAQIVDTASEDEVPGTYQTFDSPSATVYGYSLDVEAVFAAPPGPRTYQLVVGLSSRENTTNAATFELHHWSSLSALSVPFSMSSL